MDIDSLLPAEPDNYVAAAITQAYAEHGPETTYRDVRRVIFSSGISTENRRRLQALVIGERDLDSPLDLNRFNPRWLVTHAEGDATALRLLTALHPEAKEIKQGAEAGVPTRKLLLLYPAEGRSMLNTLCRTLKAMDDNRLEDLHASLVQFTPELLRERLQGTAPYAKLLAAQSWVRINLPSVGLTTANLLIPILAQVFTWHRYRLEDWALGWQVGQIHLTQAFLEAWNASPERKA